MSSLSNMMGDLDSHCNCLTRCAGCGQSALGCACDVIMCSAIQPLNGEPLLLQIFSFSRTATSSLSSWRGDTGTRRIATRDSRGPGLNITTAYRFRCKFKRIWNASEFLFNSSEEKKAESCLLINLHPLRLFSVVVRVGTGEAARLPSLRLQVWVLCFKLGGWWLLPAAGGGRLGRVNCIQMRLRCQ